VAEFSIRIPEDLNKRIEEIARLRVWSKNLMINMLLQQAVAQWPTEKSSGEKKPQKKLISRLA